MPRYSGRTILALCSLTLFASSVYAERPWRDAAVGQAVAELDSQIATSRHADEWRKFLLLDDLRHQVDRGPEADVKQIDVVISRLDPSQPGLDKPRFAKLRAALIAWRDVLAAPPLAQLSEQARAAKGQFQPIDAKRLGADRARVTKAAAALDASLKRDPQGTKLRRYLQLDALNAQLRVRGEPALEPLRDVLAQLRTREEGLDRPQFTALKAALSDYVISLNQSHNEEAEAQFDARLDKLAVNLDAYVKEPTSARVKPIAADLDWLASRRQATALVEAVSDRLSQPNFHLAVTGTLLSDGLDREINQSRAVRDVILGTNIVGTGRTQGDLTFHLLPDANTARIEATLEGVNHSRNTGYNGPAVIRTVGMTKLLATKLLTIDDEGIHGAPAKVSADTDSRITGIGSTKRGVMDCVVKRVAAKRIDQQKGQAEGIASRHAESQLRNEFEAQVATELGRANREYQEKVRYPLVHRGQLPHVFFRSTDKQLLIAATQANGPQLAAQSAAPPIVADPHLSFRLHESAVNNFLGGVLAGERIDQASMEEFAQEMLGEIPERLKSDPGKDPWEITFADEDPVTFIVNDGGFELTGRGKKYGSGGKTYPAMNFTVKYKIERSGQGVKGTRVGDIEIFPPGFVPGSGKTLSLPQATLRKLMAERLSKMFPPEIVKDQPMELKGQWKVAGPLEVVDLLADGGWLRIGWRQLPKPAQVARAQSRTTADTNDTKLEK